MRRYFVIAVVHFISSFCLAQKTVQVKQYLVKGLDDKTYSLVMKEYFTDKVTFYLSNGQKVMDSLALYGDRGIETIDIKSETFLDIKFKIRGGTGTAVRREVLICCSENKLHKSLDLISDVVSRLTEVYNKAADSLKLFDEKSDYHATLSIKQTEGKEYRAVLFESTKVESKYDPSQNVSFEKPYELYFDPSGYFFYNSTRQLSKHYKIYSNKENKTVERFIGAEVPCIQLYQKLYLRIDNEWCLDNGHDSLSCL